LLFDIIVDAYRGIEPLYIQLGSWYYLNPSKSFKAFLRFLWVICADWKTE